MTETTDVTTTDAETAFRAKASSVFHSAADKSLHELCDEYVRLSAVITDGTIVGTDEYRQIEHTPEAKVAIHERQVINAASRARFGIGFSEYDDF